MANKKRILRSRADTLWFHLIIKVHPNCESCGKPSQQAHHFFSKGLFPELRYNLDNGIGICMSCHFLLTHRGDPRTHQNIIEKRGWKWYKELEAKSKIKLRSFQTIAYYQKVIEDLKNGI